MANKKQRPVKAAKQAARKGAKPATNNKWWEQAEDVPRAGLPDAEKLSKKAKRMRRFVTASVILCPFLVLTSTVAIANGLGEDHAPAAVNANPYAATKSDAIVAVRKWMARTPSPLPGGVLVGWDSATSKKSPADPDHPGDRYAVEVHHMTVASPGGTLYDATVTLAVNDLIGSSVIGEPSLIPHAPSDSSFNETVWPGYTEIPVPAPVEEAVMTWAEAYSSGDPNNLRLVLQDTNESRSYMPLVGASLVEGAEENEPQVGPAIPLWPAGMTETEIEEAGDPKKMVVQATFYITWDGVKATGEAADSDPATVTYDLLVTKADTAAPVVVAWGGAGTGPTLKPYSNATHGRTIEVAPEDETDAENPGLRDEALPDDTKHANQNPKSDTSKKGKQP